MDNKCASCKKTVAKDQKAMNCSLCGKWEHTNHSRISDALYRELTVQKCDQLFFKCCLCKDVKEGDASHKTVNIEGFEAAMIKQADSIGILVSAVAKLADTQDRMLKATADAEMSRRLKEERDEEARRKKDEKEENDRKLEAQRRDESDEVLRKKNNVIISGSALHSLGADAESRVREVLKVLEIEDEITIHRNAIHFLNERNILLKLNADQKELMVTNRKNLRGKQLFLDDDKTFRQRKEEFELREKIKGYRQQFPGRIIFLRDGKIMTKDNETSPPFLFRYFERNAANRVGEGSGHGGY